MSLVLQETSVQAKYWSHASLTKKQVKEVLFFKARQQSWQKDFYQDNVEDRQKLDTSCKVSHPIHFEWEINFFRILGNNIACNISKKNPKDKSLNTYVNFFSSPLARSIFSHYRWDFPLPFSVVSFSYYLSSTIVSFFSSTIGDFLLI